MPNWAGYRASPRSVTGPKTFERAPHGVYKLSLPPRRRNERKATPKECSKVNHGRRFRRLRSVRAFLGNNCSLPSAGLMNTFNRIVKCPRQSLDRTFAALADPTRRLILEQLAGGDRCVTELARPYSISLPAISKHIRVLETAGLVRRHRCGRMHQLTLEAEPMKRAARWMEEYRRFWEGTLDALARYLEEKSQPQTKSETSRSTKHHEH